MEVHKAQGYRAMSIERVDVMGELLDSCKVGMVLKGEPKEIPCLCRDSLFC